VAPLGRANRKVQAGNEIVLFRHEKTFYKPAWSVRPRQGHTARRRDEGAGEAVAAYEVDYVGIK